MMTVAYPLFIFIMMPRQRPPEIWMSRSSYFTGTRWHGAARSQYSFPVDAWSVGCILYLMLLGSNVFGLKPVASDLVCLQKMLSYVGTPDNKLRDRYGWIKVGSPEPARSLPTGSPIEMVASTLLVLDPCKRSTAANAYDSLCKLVETADLD
jgi:serine/threonine protein kinase